MYVYLFYIINTKIIGVLPKGALISLAEADQISYIIVGFKDTVHGWSEIFNCQNETVFNMEMDKIYGFLNDVYIDGIILEMEYLYVNTTTYIFYNITTF